MGQNSLLPRFGIEVAGFVYGHNLDPSSGLLCGLFKEALGRRKRWIHPTRAINRPRASQAVIRFLPIVGEFVVFIRCTNIKHIPIRMNDLFEKLRWSAPFVTARTFVDVHNKPHCSAMASAIPWNVVDLIFHRSALGGR